LLEMVKWEPLIRRFGFAENVNALPALIDCPFCGGVKTNTLYPDPFYSSVWFHCNNCKAAGDPIMLVAKKMNEDIRKTAFNLKAVDLIEPYFYFTAALDIYQYKCYKAQLKHNAFWEKCRTSDLIFTSADIRAICEKLGIATPKDAASWQRGMGRLIGFATKEDAEAATAPPKMHEEEDPTEYKRHSGEYRTFVGKHWQKVVVVPFFDLPGRIREFKFISLHEGKLVYANKVLHHRKIHQKSASLSFFDQIVKHTAHEDLVVLDTLEAAIRLHAKQLREGKPLLPVVSIADLSQLDFLKALFPFKFTLCNPKLGIETFPAIKASKSRVYVDGGSDTVLARTSSSVWLDAVRSGSKDWKQVLEDWLGTVRLPEQQATVGNIEFTSGDLQDIQSGVYPRIYSTLESLDKHNRRVVTVMGEKFYQTSEGWLLMQEHSIVSAAIVVIQAIFNDREGKEKIAGYVQYKDKRYSFFKFAQELKDSGIDFIQGVLVEHTITGVDTDRRFSRFLYDIAVAFHTPRVVHVSDNFGWSSSEQVFRFKGFSISIDGELVLDEMAVLQKTVAPGSNILPPDDLSKPTLSDFLAVTDDAPMNSTFWLLAAYTARAVLGPAIGLNPMPCFFSTAKQSEELIHKICSWLGIVEEDGEKFSDSSRRWPMLLPSNHRRRLKNSFEVWLVADAKPNCLIELKPQEVAMVRLLKNYTVMNLDASLRGLNNIASYPKMLPHFLLWALQTHGLKLPPRENTLLSVLERMKEWLRVNGCENTTALDAAEERISIDDNNSTETMLECLAGICRQLVQAKELRSGLSFVNNVWLKDKHVLIDKAKILKTYQEIGFKFIDHLEIGDRLRDMFLPEHCPADRWIVSREWWDEQVVEYVQNIEANRPIKRRRPKRA